MCPNIQPVCILIVDGEKNLGNLLAQQLEGMSKYRLELCQSGRQALEVLQKKHFDVILLDYNPPDISGFTILQWLNEQKIETPVVLLAESGLESAIKGGMKLGAYDFVYREDLDSSHLPTLINGTYERYLFRRESERRGKEEQELESGIAAIEMFRQTVESISRSVNHALSGLAMGTERYQELLLAAAPEKRKELIHAFEEMQKEMEVIKVGMMSMIDLSEVLCTRYLGDGCVPEGVDGLEQILRTLKDQR